MTRRQHRTPRTARPILHPDVMETVGIVAEIMLRQRRREQQSGRSDASS
jgi:hypothetical protein